MNRQMKRAARRVDVLPVEPLVLVFPDPAIGEVEFRLDMLALMTLMSERPDLFGGGDEGDDGAQISPDAGFVGALLAYGCRSTRPDLSEEDILRNLPADPALLAALVETITGAMPQLPENPTKARPAKASKRPTGTGFFSWRRRN